MEDFFHKNSKLLVISLVGLILIGFGVLAYKIDIFSSGDSVEVLNANTETQNAGSDSHQDLVVEISGAVEKPNVYKLPQGSRIDDLLISAGGLSSDADRDWVEKYINKASKLTDGQKLYIYHSGEISARSDTGIKIDQSVLGTEISNFSSLININTASQQELEKLNGIGPVYAQNINEHRPYSTVDELLSKKIIPQKTFEKIKNAITTY
mgnify:CR=1 FL=1